MTAIRYIGRIASIPGSDGFAFIGIGSVTREDGSSHGLATQKDIFLHEDDCSSGLRVGMEATFEAVPDRKRGEGAYRAMAAVELMEADLLPDNQDAIPGFAMVVPSVRSKQEIADVARLPIHANMKAVPEDTVSQVIENLPMARIPRANDIPNDPETRQHLISWLLAMLFPSLQSFGVDYNILNSTDAEFDSQVKETIAGYEALGVTNQIELVRSEVSRFKDVRKTLAFVFQENLVRRDTVIPIGYLPDLFMAVPVWYFWTDLQNQDTVERAWENTDPRPAAAVKYFCDLFGNQRWFDTFQLFNRRVRTLRQYKGEMIPPAAVRRMQKAVALFDYVVVATPYHDQAGKDWEDIDWLRAIDPYILGFKKGVPHFFVLARFSDAGTFPLFNELVADTIEFLRTQKERLKGFNKIYNPYWLNHTGSDTTHDGDGFGNYLIRHVDQLLATFEAGNLFDWLRHEEAANSTIVVQ